MKQNPKQNAATETETLPTRFLNVRVHKTFRFILSRLPSPSCQVARLELDDSGKLRLVFQFWASSALFEFPDYFVHWWTWENLSGGDSRALRKKQMDLHKEP